MYRHVRWCFNVGKWNPSREDWLKLAASISEEELTRINKFHYQDDSKSAIIGRALIRKFVSLALEVPSNEVDLDRTNLGRPKISQGYLDKLGNEAPRCIDFNVSHSGDYCVLAGLWSNSACDSQLKVGVDVTKIVKKQSRQELDRFLELMSKREFLPQEWETVTSVSDDRQKCINFTRLWCLKECFIKSIGLGLTFKLDRICFQPSEQFRYNLNPGQIRSNLLLDTKVLIDGQPTSHWIFMETALDSEHLVAIGYHDDQHELQPSLLATEEPFAELDIRSLIESVTTIRKNSEPEWAIFSSKPSKEAFQKL